MDHLHAWEDPAPEVADLPHDSPGYRADLNRRLRLAYLSGAAEWSQIIHDRGLTDDEVRKALEGYPGDRPDRGDTPTR